MANAGVAINMDLDTFLALNPEELQVQPRHASVPLLTEGQGWLRAEQGDPRPEPNPITDSPLPHLYKFPLGSFSCSAAPLAKHLRL